MGADEKNDFDVVQDLLASLQPGNFSLLFFFNKNNSTAIFSAKQGNNFT